MKTRCLNKNSTGWKYYGAIGIKVCPRWVASFENFLEDMGRKPTPRHTIDRFPDNKGNYEPSNCRWATAKQQIQNRRPFTKHGFENVCRNGHAYTESNPAGKDKRTGSRYCVICRTARYKKGNEKKQKVKYE